MVLVSNPRQTLTKSKQRHILKDSVFFYYIEVSEYHGAEEKMDSVSQGGYAHR